LLEARMTGYLQVVDLAQLASALPARIAVARLEIGPGDFVLPSSPLLTIWPDASGGPPPALGEDVERRVRAAFATGRERTVEQDPGFAVRQLVDVALKALSPSVNDPTTAVMVVNELGVLIHHTAAARQHGGLRGLRMEGHDLWVRRFGLASVLAGLDEVIDAATTQASVLTRALEVLTPLMTVAQDDGGEALMRAAERVVAAAAAGRLPGGGKSSVLRCYERFRRGR
jgi:uncharacterized membrane protein